MLAGPGAELCPAGAGEVLGSERWSYGKLMGCPEKGFDIAGRAPLWINSLHAPLMVSSK